MADVIGIEAVVRLIEQSGLKDFVIRRHGESKASYPMFESRNNTKLADTVKEFKNWAATIETANSENSAYDIDLFMRDDEENEDSIGRQKRQWSNRICFSFALKNQNNIGVIGSTAANMKEQIEQAVQLALSERDKLDMQRRIKELEEQINEYEDEISELSEKPNHLEQLAATVLPVIANGMIKKTNPEEVTEAAAVNGVGLSVTFTEEQRKNINSAIKKLAIADSKIDVHLLKLAEISENNTFQFNMLINALESL